MDDLRLKDLPPGQWFAVTNKPEFPKLKLKGSGYIDLRFLVRHTAPGQEWPVIRYSEETVREILKMLGKWSDEQIENKIKFAKDHL